MNPISRWFGYTGCGFLLGCCNSCISDLTTTIYARVFGPAYQRRYHSTSHKGQKLQQRVSLILDIVTSTEHESNNRDIYRTGMVAYW
jgi:hypothetical protein